MKTMVVSGCVMEMMVASGRSVRTSNEDNGSVMMVMKTTAVSGQHLQDDTAS
jgi:hypothetical protein